MKSRKTFPVEKLSMRPLGRRDVKTMTSENYKYKNMAHNARSVGASEYHLQWCTKYRFDVLAGESLWKDCENAIRDAALKHCIEIVEIGVMEDHVHVVAKIPPYLSVAHATGLLKGASSYYMFRSHPEVKERYWGGHFWGRGYFYRSVSNVTDDIVRRYVREDNNQRQKRLFT